MNRLIKFLKKLQLSVKAFFKTYKYGGYNEIHIKSINAENLLASKKIIVTGGGSGIGLAIARKFSAMGADVIITGRNEAKLKEACADNKLRYLVFDITDKNAFAEKTNTLMEMFDGEIDILVNNAGAQPNEFFPNVSICEWERIYNTNSKGTFFISQEICNHWMKKQSSTTKKIINISSQGAFVGATYPYRMSKWDICGFTQGLALKMANYGVLVNAIAPGVVKTEMQKFALQQGENTFCNQNLLNRVCLPEEIAEMAAFIASDACNFMTGQTILVDGGYSLR